MKTFQLLEIKNKKWASSKQPPEVFYQKCALKNFVNLTKKRKPEQFSCGFCETFKNTFLQNISGRLLLQFQDQIQIPLLERSIQDHVKQLWWRFFEKIVNGLSISAQRLHHRCLTRSKITSINYQKQISYPKNP